MRPLLIGIVVLSWGVRAVPVPAGPPTFAGPAMGTTYRVTLAAPVAGVPTPDLHRDVEDLLARIDRAASTWRDDADASRVNRAPAGEWVPVANDLVAILEIAAAVHDESGGVFDVTVAPLVRLWGGGPGGQAGPPPSDAAIAAALADVGMRHLQMRRAGAGTPAAVRKGRAGVAIDLAGIAPGYAVDRIGELLMARGSDGHLVELGGEVRAWGTGPGHEAWRVRLRDRDGAVVTLAAGEAVGSATCRPGRSPLDPRTGRPAASAPRTVGVRAATCAEADAWAVAALVADVPPGADGTLHAARVRSHGTGVRSPAASRSR
jgi:thiamine biosynthesis lipoprotein